MAEPLTDRADRMCADEHRGHRGSAPRAVIRRAGRVIFLGRGGPACLPQGGHIGPPLRPAGLPRISTRTLRRAPLPEVAEEEPTMTSLPMCDAALDHLLTPRNSALIIIDFQPIHVRSIKS